MNTLIRASAGSGKTYALTTRHLRLLRAGASPQTILATTFTRKAAGEILGVSRLADAASGGEGAGRSARGPEVLIHAAECRRLASSLSQLPRLHLDTG